MKNKIIVQCLVICAIFAFTAPVLASATNPPPFINSLSATLPDNSPEGITPTTNPTGLYIIQFSDPALASYTGGIRGLAATSPIATGERRLNARSNASQAYINYLSEKQSTFTKAMDNTLGRSVEVAFNYVGALNAVAVRVSPAEAARLAGLPGVVAVYPDTIRTLDTDIGPEHIGAPTIWDGYTGPGVATRGEGIVIGVIDTGINSQHPSFAATDGDGYVHTNPYGVGVFKGWCATNPGFCNAKLIAAYTFHPNGGSPEDIDGHGSHTASTAGGNAHLADFMVGGNNFQIEISGVAPRANIVAYKVCDPTCPTTASVAAINSAILNDMVDVLNYSISGVDSPWTDIVDLAFLEAFKAGIFVSASAGNSGPGPGTIAKTGPWNAAVAASTHKRVIGQTVDVTGPTAPAELQGMVAVPGQNTVINTNINGTLKYDAANNLGCTAFTPGTFTGALALIQRGSCAFANKVNNAAAAGASGVVMFNSVGGPPIAMGGLTGTPQAVMLDLASGLALRDYVLANPTTTTIQINSATSYVINEDWEDITAGFSSRGPSQFELLKPDYIAPGVNILAAYAAKLGDAAQYNFLQGTSMSSPHGAGAAALMMALHPTWNPAEIKSALASTALPTILKEDGITPATPFDAGSGLVNLSQAASTGIVLDESHANFVAANPGIGGDPKTLNLPSMVNYACATTCTWYRTVKSVLDFPVQYNASTTSPAGMTITVSPSSFTILPGETQVLTITTDTTALTGAQYAFGSVILATTDEFPTEEPGVLLIGSTAGGSLGSITFTKSDILAYDGSDWSLFFNGAAFGLGFTTIDGFHLLDNGDLLLSFATDVRLPGLGGVSRNDVVRLVPASMPPITSGAWQMFFDASDVGYAASSENLDALYFDEAAQTLYFSTAGNFAAPGVSGKDEDLVAFQATSLGWTTAGTSSLFFKGMLAGLGDLSTEDLKGLWIAPDGELYLSNEGVFTMPGLSGNGKVIFTCTPAGLSCTANPALFFDGNSLGFPGAISDFQPFVTILYPERPVSNNHFPVVIYKP